ncbi:maestro heat-like repeat-containing protein family member 1 [Uloborus diversus]|uniref:maestro heat-like repeat-containing protein family member 1 n=2 Tax=Uloborus diversus TaxID=327109 RepID=UPI002409B0D6|nr:maestro heat-like repeat-containing protein family member 1 [Uloborus diversus]
MMPNSGEDSLKTTGGQIDNIVFALIDATLDRNDNVTQAVQTSLFNIGKHQPNLVLSSCHSYLSRHPKLALVHKLIILSVIEKICNETLNSLQKNVAEDLIKLAFEEMVNTKEIVPEWQNLASGILVSLGRKYQNEVMEQLLSNFQPGILPHFFVVQTMANLASANVFGIVPFLKPIIGTMLPLLGIVKQENMKWIFAHALSKFCEAILECISNAEKSPDPYVTKDTFSTEISSAYDILFNNWLPSREAKVRSEVVVALGYMTHLLSSEKLEELLPKFFPAVLGIYKRHQEFQHTTQGLCMVLDAAVSNHSVVLESHLDSILAALFPQVCTLPDYSQPSGVRNHNEVLRCFAVLTSVYSNRLLSFLLQRLDSNNESYKIGSLTVIKHLINSCDEHISSKIPLIISGIKPVLESGNKVKKVIAQVIVTLAHHDHLKSNDGLDLVCFVIQQCALPDDPTAKRPGDPNYVSNEALRNMCENVMHLLTTTVETMEEILWPNIMDCLMSEELTAAVTPVCKSLTGLASKKREELTTDFAIDYGCLSKVPTCQALLGRLLVLIGHPHENKGRGIHVLKLLKVLAPAINKNFTLLADSKIPHLLQFLEGTDSIDWNQTVWEEHVTEFVVQTLSEIDREEWALKFGKALQSQFHLYVNSPDDKYFLLKILGLVMKKVGNKNFINEALDIIFKNVNHSNDIERLGCAIAVGYCGSTHLDTVLVKLEKVAKDDKKNAGLFGFIKEFTGDAEHEKLKATIISCYGHVTLRGPVPILSTRIETPILRSVANFYQSSKDIIVKQSMLETVKLIADAVHPDHLNETFEFRSRNELLNLMKNILKSEMSNPLISNVRSLALKASASLVALDPALKDDEKRSIIQVAVGSVYSLPRDYLLEKPKEEGIDLTLDFDQLLISTVDSLNYFLQKLLTKEKTFSNLETIIQILSTWMTSINAVERERCLHSTLHLLRAFAEASESDAYSPFHTLGFILGVLVPRCTDPQITVRHLAFDSIDVAVAIAMKVQVSAVTFNEQPGISLSYLKQQIISDEPSSLFSVTKSLGKFVSDKLPLEQLYPFLRSLIDGFCDPHPQSSTGASVVLNTIIKCRGREIRQEVPNILDAVRDKLNYIQCPQTRKGALLTFKNLADHHLSAVLVTLLNSPVPLDMQTVDIWKTLALEKTIVNLIIENFLEMFSDNVLSSPPDPHGRSTAFIAAHKPLSAICALREMFKVPEMASSCKDHFDRIFSSILVVIAAYVGAVLPIYCTDSTKSTLSGLSRKSDKSSSSSPVRFAIEAMKNLLMCVNQEVIVTSMTEGGYWVMMEETDKYPEAVAALGRSVCACCPEQVPKIIAFLNPLLNSSVDVQRIISVSLFVEFLSQTYTGRKALTEPLMNNLLGRLVDSSPIVRRLCISGLGSVADTEQVERYSTTILSAMMTGMDDREDSNCNITLEAMSGLSAVLSQVAEEDVRNILITIALRIKPMFEKDKAPVRAAAFKLFGNLSRFGNGPSKEQFIEQVHGNLVAILLHLNDEDKHVIRACKYSLRLLGPLLQSQEMNSMFQKHLLEDAHLHYGEFINDLTKTMIADFPEKISFYVTTSMSYLKSQFPIIQCNAIAFLGYLLGNLPVEKQNLIPKERVCSAMLVLLKDQSSEVRIRTAEALSLLHEF